MRTGRDIFHDPRSGVTKCRCRDCFDTVYSADTASPDFCPQCKEAGCEALGDCLKSSRADEKGRDQCE